MNAASAAERRDHATGHGPAPIRRGAARPAPVRNPALAHLDLAALRRYRVALTAEEGRVAYWRRVVETRLDVVRAAIDGVDAVDHLRDVVAGVPVRSERSALLGFVGADDMPALPELSRLWLAEAAPGDDAANSRLLATLEEGERLLADYRAALLRRLDAATAELIARYRDEPASCLAALPRQR